MSLQLPATDTRPQGKGEEDKEFDEEYAEAEKKVKSLQTQVF